VLNKKGIIIIHRHKKEIDTFPKNFYFIDEKKYGISKIIFGSYS
jgi:16S rRNA (guanine966-N2)-methyltransferase